MCTKQFNIKSPKTITKEVSITCSGKLMYCSVVVMKVMPSFTEMLSAEGIISSVLFSLLASCKYEIRDC